MREKHGVPKILAIEGIKTMNNSDNHGKRFVFNDAELQRELDAAMLPTAREYKIGKWLVYITDALLAFILFSAAYLVHMETLPVLTLPILTAAFALVSYYNHNHS